MVPARPLLAGEDGASYSGPFVLVLPLYAFLIALIVECTLLAQVKMGTLHAAYAAARAAAVWLPAEIPDENRRGMIHLAAIEAIWPWASGSTRHAQAGEGSFPLDDRARKAAEASIAAYRSYSGGKLDQDYLVRKWMYAAKATEVQIETSTQPVDNSDPATVLTVTVEYETPIQVPGLGWLLGSAPSWRGCDFRTRKIASTVTLEAEVPKSLDRRDPRLGIHYYENPGYTTRGAVVRAASSPNDRSSNGGTP